MNLQQKLTKLKKTIIPFKFRVWAKINKWRNYLVLPYIDARDCMDVLDEIFWIDRQREYKDIWGKAYCEVSLWDGTKWITRSDVGEKSNISADKGASSDAFKRACVNRWLGRFLYTMPVLSISASEEEKNKYNITNFVKKKYKKEITDWIKEENFDIFQESDYSIDEDEKDDETNIDDLTKDFSKVKQS